jgi:hypothetical protein
LGELTVESDERIGSQYSPEVKLIGVSADQGLSSPKTPVGKIPERYKVLQQGFLAYNPMRINIGSIGVVRSKEEEGITSPDYVVFSCRNVVFQSSSTISCGVSPDDMQSSRRPRDPSGVASIMIGSL